jgi:hypothetical protein
MDKIIGVILICLNTVPAEACDETTASDVIANQVRSELDCITGWQEDIGRSAFREEIGKTAYVKTLCRRIRTPEPKAPRR